MDKGVEFMIESDKIASLSDIPAWCHFTGNQLINSERKDSIYRFQVKKMAEKGNVTVMENINEQKDFVN